MPDNLGWSLRTQRLTSFREKSWEHTVRARDMNTSLKVSVSGKLISGRDDQFQDLEDAEEQCDAPPRKKHKVAAPTSLLVESVSEEDIQRRKTAEAWEAIRPSVLKAYRGRSRETEYVTSDPAPGSSFRMHHCCLPEDTCPIPMFCDITLIDIGRSMFILFSIGYCAPPSQIVS